MDPRGYSGRVRGGRGSGGGGGGGGGYSDNSRGGGGRRGYGGNRQDSSYSSSSWVQGGPSHGGYSQQMGAHRGGGYGGRRGGYGGNAGYEGGRGGYGGGGGRRGGRTFTPACYMPLSGSLESQMSNLRISPSLELTKDGKRALVPRPADGGKTGVYNVTLMVNHFKLDFGKSFEVSQYDFDVKRAGGAAMNIKRSDLLAVKEKHFGDASQVLSYDGGRNIYSPTNLKQGAYNVELNGRNYTVTLKFQRTIAVKDLSRPPFPREVLQGLDVIMRQNAAMENIAIGSNFYSTRKRQRIERVVALEGFQLCIKSTEKGLVICVDHSVMPFREPVDVIDFLKDSLRMDINHRTQFSVQQYKDAENALRELRIKKTYLMRDQKFKIFGLTEKTADMIKFLDHTSNKERTLADYFWATYNLDIKYKKLPCLSLRKDRDEFVPLEFCKLADWQKYPKKSLRKEEDIWLRDMALVSPKVRMTKIQEIVKQQNGPPSRGLILDKFHMVASRNMEEAKARVLHRPNLKLCSANDRELNFQISNDNCQWNLQTNKVLKGVRIDNWAILDFSAGSRTPLYLDEFIPVFVNRCNNLGILTSYYPFVQPSRMDVLSKHNELHKVLYNLKRNAGGKLQIVLCPMADLHDGYNILKYICEIELGIMTQCCLTSRANNSKGKDQYLANLALKINVKLGGINFELFDCHHSGEYVSCPVMFIGADVNHPRSGDIESPSIAAVTGSINWPASSYFSVVQAQKHRKETILHVGKMCSVLIGKYFQVHGFNPNRILYFRDGVSDSQFDMVVNEELTEIKKAIESNNYKPQITVVVTQKRHQTRLFHKGSDNDKNVLPGTVVDRGITAPVNFNFYLCSHNGIKGTSKPGHYYVLWDEYGFGSDELQNLIYSLCFTFARCTKPVSLVTPVYYADILAYRGRIYYEAWYTMGKGHSVSTSSHSASTSSGPAFSIRLHDDIMDKMFFL